MADLSDYDAHRLAEYIYGRLDAIQSDPTSDSVEISEAVETRRVLDRATEWIDASSGVNSCRVPAGIDKSVVRLVADRWGRGDLDFPSELMWTIDEVTWHFEDGRELHRETTSGKRLVEFVGPVPDGGLYALAWREGRIVSRLVERLHVNPWTKWT